MFTCHVCTGAPGQGRVLDILDSGLMVVVSTKVGAGNLMGPLQEQHTRLPAEPSLQSLVFCFEGQGLPT